MCAYPINTPVNSVKNDERELLEELTAQGGARGLDELELLGDSDQASSGFLCVTPRRYTIRTPSQISTA